MQWTKKAPINGLVWSNTHQRISSIWPILGFICGMKTHLAFLKFLSYIQSISFPLHLFFLLLLLHWHVIIDHVSFIFVFFCVFCCRWRASFHVFCYQHQHGILLLLCVLMYMMSFFFGCKCQSSKLIILFFNFLFLIFYFYFDFFLNKLRINLKKERYFFPFRSFFSFMCLWEE